MGEMGGIIPITKKFLLPALLFFESGQAKNIFIRDVVCRAWPNFLDGEALAGILL